MFGTGYNENGCSLHRMTVATSVITNVGLWVTGTVSVGYSIVFSTFSSTRRSTERMLVHFPVGVKPPYSSGTQKSVDSINFLLLNTAFLFFLRVYCHYEECSVETIVAASTSHPLFGTISKFLEQVELYEKSGTLLPCSYIIQLVFLADGNLEHFRGRHVLHCYHDPHCFDSLHHYRKYNLVKRIRENLNREAIPHNWVFRMTEAMS